MVRVKGIVGWQPKYQTELRRSQLNKYVRDVQAARDKKRGYRVVKESGRE